MVIMIVVGVALFALAIAAIWYALARSSQSATVSEEDFEAVYDELVSKGEMGGDDREAAWQEFHAWQLENEAERRSWEEGPAD
jgi:hypothetical protein